MSLNIVLLVGGVGGAKLAYGLAQILTPQQLTIIVNTGDDFWHYGLRICPDLDTITYTLSDRVDRTRGWGVSEDTYNTLDALKTVGEKPWFTLGDHDLATHLIRTQRWHAGQRLTSITHDLKTQYGVACTILPMTDDQVATMVMTAEHGELEFQEYFVKHRWQPTLQSLRYDGIEQATLSEEARAAIMNADAIILGPSNPWLSINPILAVPGMRDLLRSRDVPRIAVTPIIQGQAVKGPTAKIMRELDLDISPHTVVETYGEVINGFVYDVRDADLHLNALRATALDTLMTDEGKRVQLARHLLDWLAEWIENYEHLGNHPG